MVILNLKEIFKSRKRFTGFYRFSPKDIGLPADMGEIKEPVLVYVEIVKDGAGYKAKLEIEGNVVLECSRCLSSFTKSINITENIRVEPYPTRDVIHIRPKDLNVSFFEEEEKFNLTDLVREQIILSLPIKPLCDPECKGIPLEEKPKEDVRFSLLKKFIK